MPNLKMMKTVQARKDLLVDAMAGLSLLTATAVLMLSAAWPSHAGEIYRCTVDGKAVIGDEPCRQKPVAVRMAAIVSATAPILLSQGAHRFQGKWFGPMHFQARSNGAAVDGARAMVQAAFVIDDNGSLSVSVSGSAPEMGCQFRGMAVWDDLLDSYALEVSATGCKRSEFNKRYRGQMLLSVSDGNATLDLSSTDYIGVPARLAQAEARALLHH